MKAIFEKLMKKGYEVHNKRVLGDPKNTSEETRRKDAIQEIALVVEWLRVVHDIHVYTRFDKVNKTYYWWLQEHDANHEEDQYDSPQEAYSAAFDYVLNNLI